MSEHGGAVSELVDQLGRLPGIGRKSAERLAFHLLRVSETEALALAESIRRVRQDVQYCVQCYNLSENESCVICADSNRDQTRLCVVEQPRDLMSLEQAGIFRVFTASFWDGLHHWTVSGRINSRLTPSLIGSEACRNYKPNCRR